MTDRAVEIADRPASLSIDAGRLMISQDGAIAATVPLGDLGVLVVSNQEVRYTQAVLTSIAANGAALVTCDERHMPMAMLLPLQAHHLQTERVGRQATISRPTAKRLWQQIVKTKIVAQGRLLDRLHGADEGLRLMAARVRSGDPDNLEAQAARRYWVALFDDPNFRRDRTREDQNRHLNYGYAILRAVVARGICGTGLHPSLGLHHRNRYNAFCLADDLMEPWRPIVDEIVAALVRERGREVPMDREARLALLGILARRLDDEGEMRTLFDCAARTAGSLVGVLEGTARQLRIAA